MKKFFGQLKKSNCKFAVVQSKFNEFITENLLKGALDCFEHWGIEEQNIHLFKVPGAFELPVTADKLASLKIYDAIVCLGAVIRGDTPHFEYISNAVSLNLARSSINNKVPIIFGVLTTNTLEQAIERTGEKQNNKGWEAAEAAIEMADLFEKIKSIKN